METVQNLTLFVHNFLLLGWSRVAHLNNIYPDLCGLCATGSALLVRNLRERGFDAYLVAGYPVGYGIRLNVICHYWVLIKDPHGDIHADPTFLQFDVEQPIRVSRDAPLPDAMEWRVVHTIDFDWEPTQHPATHWPLLGLGTYQGLGALP